MRITAFLLTSSLTLNGVFAAPVFAGEDPELKYDVSHLVEDKFVGSDGQNYEVWVDPSFLNATTNIPRSTTLDERDTGLSPDMFGKYRIKWQPKDSAQNKCRGSSFVGDTGPHAPTTGRCKAIQEWARTHNGQFASDWKSITPGKYRAILASSASGTTTCMFGINHSAWEVRIGNSDIYDLVRDSLNKFTQNFNGVYRVRSWGSADCDGDLVQDGSAELKWWMSESFS